MMTLTRTTAIGLGLASMLACSGNMEERVSPDTVDDAVTSARALDRVRFFPRASYASRMVGGKFQGSNSGPNSGFVDLATITQAPAQGAWSELSFANTTDYRYVRYLAPDGGYGNVAEVEFYSGARRLAGSRFGSAGSWNNYGNTYDKALDANTSTFYDASTASGAYLGLDLGPLSSCALASYEAEAMNHSTGAATADGWNIWGNGSISTAHTFVAGRITIKVVAKGTFAGNAWPHMRVLVGSTLVGQADVSSGTYREYPFEFDASAGAAQLRIEFDNDYYSGSEDRNLLVDKVTVGCVTTGGNGGGGSGGTGGGAGSAGSGAGGSGGSGGAGAGGTAGTGGSGGASGSGGSPAVERPPQLCSSPLALADTSTPRTVVGSGTAESCTEAALRTAVAGGGVITFNCGPAVKTINITQTLVAPTDRDTTIDGNDRIVLDGGGTTQILRASRQNFRVNDRVLRVQRLVMQRGRDLGTNFVPRDGTKKCAWGYKDGGGGAIYTRDMNIHVWGVTFLDNRGPEIGPDVAGGAIYSLGAKEVVVANSIFRRNSASNGGGIGLLHVSAKLYNVVFENNKATGLLANFAGATGCPVFNHAEQGGAGGLGGAFYSDGQDPGDTFCGVRMSDNVSGDLGGALFRSAYWGLIAGQAKQTIVWDKSTFERNQSAAGGGGAAYVNNSLFIVKGSTFNGNSAGPADGGALKITGATVQFSSVAVTGNKASWGGGIAHWAGGPDGVGSASGVTYSGNTPNDVVGDFPR